MVTVGAVVSVVHESVSLAVSGLPAVSMIPEPAAVSVSV